MQEQIARLIELVSDALAGVVADEAEEEDSIYLTAFENRPSRMAERLLGSSLSRRYHLGGRGRTINHSGLMARGYESVQLLERLAHIHGESWFGAAHSDFRLLSGLHATTCTLSILTESGDTVYSLSAHDGGHLATAQLVTRLGRRSAMLPDRANWRGWNSSELAASFAAVPPAAILVDCGIQIAHLDIRNLRETAGPRCLLIFDASHTLGLIGGNCDWSPLAAGCDVLQGNTHKSFFGPHRALALFRAEDLGRRFSDKLGAFVSSQLTSSAMSLYLSVLEMAAFGREYAEAVARNGNDLGRQLQQRGWELFNLQPGLFTETNLLLAEAAAGIEPFELCRRLANTGIVANARLFRGRPVLRIGVQEITRLGFDATAVRTLADLMDRAVRDTRSASSLRGQVRDLKRAFRNIRYSFDALLTPQMEQLLAKAAVHR
jgi:glycine hydroxymethyltransferase